MGWPGTSKPVLNWSNSMTQKPMVNSSNQNWESPVVVTIPHSRTVSIESNQQFTQFWFLLLFFIFISMVEMTRLFEINSCAHLIVAQWSTRIYFLKFYPWWSTTYILLTLIINGPDIVTVEQGPIRTHISNRLVSPLHFHHQFTIFLSNHSVHSTVSLYRLFNLCMNL